MTDVVASVRDLKDTSRMRGHRKILGRLDNLVQAQLEELLDMRPYAEGHGLPTLREQCPHS